MLYYIILYYIILYYIILYYIILYHIILYYIILYYIILYYIILYYIILYYIILYYIILYYIMLYYIILYYIILYYIILLLLLLLLLSLSLSLSLSLLLLLFIWPACQSKLPKNIFNFTICYINNSLPTHKNLQRWGLSSSSECSFCINPESLLHVVAGCSSYLDRFTWRHDSILNFIANNLPSEHIRTIYADLSSFSNPSTIIGDDYRPVLLILTKDNCLYIPELTVGYETNLRNNVNRKYSKYKDMIMEQKKNYHAVNFINLSISAFGVFDKES